jgi:hypothetical protein
VCVGTLAFRQTSGSQLKDIHLQSADLCIDMFFLDSDMTLEKRQCGKAEQVYNLASGFEA